MNDILLVIGILCVVVLGSISFVYLLADNNCINPKETAEEETNDYEH